MNQDGTTHTYVYYMLYVITFDLLSSYPPTSTPYHQRLFPQISYLDFGYFSLDWFPALRIIIHFDSNYTYIVLYIQCSNKC